MHYLRTIYNPPAYQGAKKKRKYFEGWYHKHVSADGQHAISVIGGISHNENKESQAFIQIIDGESGRTAWIPFPAEAFVACPRSYDVWIGNNHFHSRGLTVDVSNDEITFKADLEYNNLTDLQNRSLFQPGIMGWYRFVPRMECYHGIVSLDHQVSGTITIDDTTVNMDGGYGYMEKDWGRSMPNSWIWFQTNYFTDARASIMFSLADIPWMSSSFPGFLAICHTGETQQRFSTYNGAKISAISVGDTNVRVEFVNDTHVLTVDAQSSASGTLLAPQHGSMVRPIGESLDTKAQIRLSDHKGRKLLDTTTSASGLEQVGPTRELVKAIQKKYQTGR